MIELCSCLKRSIHLGLLQARWRNMTPPAQERVHVVHGDQPDHTPSMGLGPSSPYSTQMPFRHHCSYMIDNYDIWQAIRQGSTW